MQSLVRRLHKFQPDDFDVLVTDESHHSIAPTYRKIFDYFKPRLHLGFTATPNRNDGVGLKAIYEDIIYERNLKWGIENGYLSNIHCLRVDIGVDLRHVAQRLGDYAPESFKYRECERGDSGSVQVIRKAAMPDILRVSSACGNPSEPYSRSSSSTRRRRSERNCTGLQRGKDTVPDELHGVHGGNRPSERADSDNSPPHTKYQSVHADDRQRDTSISRQRIPDAD